MKAAGRMAFESQIADGRHSLTLNSWEPKVYHIDAQRIVPADEITMSPLNSDRYIVGYPDYVLQSASGEAP